MFIEKISGDYLNVVDLSLSLLHDKLLKLDYNIHKHKGIRKKSKLWI